VQWDLMGRNNPSKHNRFNVRRAPDTAQAFGRMPPCSLTIFVVDVLVGQMRALVQHHACMPYLRPSRAERTSKSTKPGIFPVLVCSVEREKCGEEKPSCGVDLREERHDV